LNAADIDKISVMYVTNQYSIILAQLAFKLLTVRVGFWLLSDHSFTDSDVSDAVEFLHSN